MAIYTPRGLKINLDKELVFTYTARLQPRFTAFEVLKTVEGIQSIPSTIAFGTGMYLFFNNYSPTNIAIYVGIATLIGGFIMAYGLFIIPFLTRFVTGLSFLKGFGFFSIGILITGFLTVGWKGALFYFIGHYSAFVILLVINAVQMKVEHKKTGLLLSVIERSFFSAYKLHASRMGITTSLDLEVGELESGKWRLSYMNLQHNWPELTARFTDNNN